MRLQSRWATEADLLAFYGQPYPRSVRARVLEREGEIVGVAGWYVEDGRAVMFSDLKDGVPKVTIWREAKAMMQRMTGPAVCVAAGDGAMLRRLGWTRSHATDDGEVYEWAN